MKKAKIMLTALVVLGIAGGALAFKANKGAKIYCTDQLGKVAGVDCPISLDYTTTNQGDRFQSTCTTKPGAVCVPTSITFQN